MMNLTAWWCGRTTLTMSSSWTRQTVHCHWMTRQNTITSETKTHMTVQVTRATNHYAVNPCKKCKNKLLPKINKWSVKIRCQWDMCDKCFAILKWAMLLCFIPWSSVFVLSPVELFLREPWISMAVLSMVEHLFREQCFSVLRLKCDYRIQFNAASLLAE